MPLIPVSPFDLDSVIVALITGVISFAVAYLTSRAQHKTNSQQADKLQAETEHELRQQLAETDKQLRELSHTVSDELEQRRKAETELIEAINKTDTAVAYTRALGHWLNSMCSMLDSEWLARNPKPRLPATIRHDVENAAALNGLEVSKFDNKSRKV